MTTKDKAKKLYNIKLDSVRHDSADTTGLNDLLLYSESFNVSTDPASVNEAGSPNSIKVIEDNRPDLGVVMLGNAEIAKVSATDVEAVDLPDNTPVTFYFGHYPDNKDKSNDVAKYLNGTHAGVADAWIKGIASLSENEEYTPVMIFSTTIPTAEKNPNDQINADQKVIEVGKMMYATPICNPFFKDYSFNNVSTYSVPTNSIGNLTLPGFYDNSLLGSSILFGGGLLYHSRVCANSDAGIPYAPIMGPDQGKIDTSIQLAATYKKSERQSLSEKGFSVIRNKSYNGLRSKYITDNRSLRTPTTDDDIAEEQNRRFMNFIHNGIDNLLDQYVGKYNMDETRDKVEKGIDDWFANNVTILSPFGISSYTRQCNAENNPITVVKQHRLAVKVGVVFNNAVREVDVLYRIIPVV